MISTVIAFFIVLCLSPIYAGENEHGHHKKISNKEISIQMDMTGPLDLAMSRDGSGTAWQPDTSPISMMMIDISEWQLMFHGSIFAGGDFQGSSRGGIAPFSSNWIMGSIGHNLGSGRILAKTMLSLEPFTIAEGGYPLLLQTGETWKGEPLHDRQHPHDLFMELALKYVVPIKDTIALLIYVAPAGEPALGPVAFPHRVSARSNPLAPLGHHWYDSTHISFGVMTAGMFTRQWMFEASWFNGREPDENRYNIDLKIPDSYAGRISFNPSGQLSLQASYGFLKTPEPSEPDINVHRITSSVSSNFKPWNGSNIASSLIFGLNIPSSGKPSGFALVECDFDLTKHHTLFGRIEGGTKIGEELVLSPVVNHKSFFLGALSLGYAFHFPTIWKLAPAIGGVGTLNVLGSELGTYYTGPVQMGGMLFAHLRLSDHE